MNAEAGAGSGQDDGQAGSGAPAGGLPEGGSENDDKPITAKQLKAILASQKQGFQQELQERLTAQAREFDAFKAGAARKEQPVEAPKRYTRAELRAAVDANQVTQEQADDVWAKQVREEAVELATEAANAVAIGRTQKERIDSDLSAYKRLKPEIMQAGETRQKIAEEYKYLTSIGAQPTVETELAAIRAVLGPLDKLERSANARRASESEEQGGEGGEARQRGGSSKKLVDHLSADVKKKYEARIASGLYKDWDAVEKELKYASPNVRQRLGLPAA